MNRRDLIKTAGAFSLAAVTPLQPALAQDAPPPATLKIQRLSWAGLKLQSSKTTVLIDPLVTKAVWGDSWKEEIVPITIQSGPRWVLLTHLHNDHFDPAAIRGVATEHGF